MHALSATARPSYDEKTDAVLLYYSETSVTVLSTDKIRTHVRARCKILRPADVIVAQLRRLKSTTEN